MKYIFIIFVIISFCYSNKIKSYGILMPVIYSYKGIYLDGDTVYYSNGDKVIVSYKNGYKKNNKLHSKLNKKQLKQIIKLYQNNKFVLMVYDNGNIERVIGYSNGKTNGITLGYKINGMLKYKRRYKNGKLDGDTKYYDKNRDIIDIERYKNGKLKLTIIYKNNKIFVKRWYENKKIVKDAIFYKNGKVSFLNIYDNKERLNSTVTFSTTGIKQSTKKYKY